MIWAYVRRVDGGAKLMLGSTREKAKSFVPEGTLLHQVGFFNSAFKAMKDVEKCEGVWSSESASNWMTLFVEDTAHGSAQDQADRQADIEASQSGSVSS